MNRNFRISQPSIFILFFTSNNNRVGKCRTHIVMSAIYVCGTRNLGSGYYMLRAIVLLQRRNPVHVYPISGLLMGYRSAACFHLSSSHTRKTQHILKGRIKMSEEPTNIRERTIIHTVVVYAVHHTGMTKMSDRVRRRNNPKS